MKHQLQVTVHVLPRCFSTAQHMATRTTEQKIDSLGSSARKAAMQNRRADPLLDQLKSACSEFNARQSRRSYDRKGGSQGGVPHVTEKLDQRPCQNPPPKTSADHLLTKKTLTAARGLHPRTHVLGRLGTTTRACLEIDSSLSNSYSVTSFS